MKTGKSLTELAAELERQNSSKRDFAVRTGAVNMEVVDLDAIADETEKRQDLQLAMPDSGVDPQRIGKIAHQQIGAYTKIPKPYYDRMRDEAPELLAENVNHWMHGKNEQRMMRTLDGRARAWLSTRYRPLDNYDLACAVIPALLGAGAEVCSSEVTESRLYIKATTAQITAEVKPGDVIQAGVIISNSEVGQGSLQVAPFSLRLICTNGMTHADYGKRKAHLGKQFVGDVELATEWMKDDTRRVSDAAFFGQVRDLVHGWFDGKRFEEVVVSKMREASANTIEADPVKVVEISQKRFGFSDHERGGVLNALVQGADMTQWGLANAITRMSTDVGDYDRATEIEGIGGQVIELPKNQWETILAEANTN